MPKIRTKKSGNVFKSGLLSSEFRKFEKSNFVNFDYNNLTSLNKNIDITPFNDKQTKFYLQDLLTFHYTQEDKYLVSSPNEIPGFKVFATLKKLNKTFLITEDTESDAFILSDKFDESRLSYYTQEKYKKSIDIKSNPPENEKAYFSFSRNTEEIEGVNLGKFTYGSRNTNTAYWDFGIKRWVFLGDGNKNYFNSVQDFLEAPILTNNVQEQTNQTQGSIKYSGGNITTTFGFPSDKKFASPPSSQLSMKDYILQDFNLEKIKVRIKLSYDFDTNITRSFFNYLNFFVINNRKNNEATLNSINDDTFDLANFYRTSDISQNKLTLVNSHRTHELESSTQNNFSISNTLTTAGDLTQEFVDALNLPFYFPDLENHEVRELVCHSKILIHNNGTSKFSQEFIQNDADHVIDVSSEDSHDITFEFVPTVQGKYGINIDKLTTISNLSFYPSCRAYGKGFLNRPGSRSEIMRNENFELVEGDDILVEDGDITIKEMLTTRTNAEYVLKASDNLTFGLTFSPGMGFSQTSNIGKDLLTIVNGLDIKLVGTYKKQELDEVKHFSNIIQKNITQYLKIGGEELDDRNESLIHNKKAYYNRVREKDLATGITSFYFKENGEKGSSINSTQGFFTESVIDSQGVNKLFWNYYRFGHFADYIKTDPWHPVENKGNETNVKKRTYDSSYNLLATEYL